MPLSYADKGRPMSVCRITGPQNVKNHLADLGFSPQSLVVVKPVPVWSSPDSPEPVQ